MTYSLHCGDALVVLREMPDNSVDAICADPPSGISFMNLPFDSDRGGRDQWVAWLSAIMREALRVTKPGGHAFIWALPRTSHWTAMALEDAGWTIREKCYHLFGSGFPKSLNVSAAIDKAAGAEREVVGRSVRLGDNKEYDTDRSGGTWKGHTGLNGTGNITAPATDLARQWNGWGTALKPAVEEWILCRKPLERGLSIAANVQKWSTGALNIDASRIGTTERLSQGSRKPGGNFDDDAYQWTGVEGQQHAQGRWPSNILLSHSGGCRQVGTRRVKTGNHIGHNRAGTDRFPNKYGKQMLDPGVDVGYAAADGMEVVDAFICVPGCAVAELDRQSGERTSNGGKGPHRVYAHAGKQGYHGNPNDFNTHVYGDTGGASRYFKVFGPEDIVPIQIDVCWLCDAPRHGIMSVTQGDVTPCQNDLIQGAVSSAEQPTNQSSDGHGSAQNGAQEPQPHEHEDSSQSNNGHVSTVASSSKSTSPTHTPIAHSDVWDLRNEQFVQTVKSAGNLCDSCATAIAQSIVQMQQGRDRVSRQCLDSMPAHKRQILNHSLALFAESQGDIATIPTTASLKLFLGYVRYAIESTINSASDDQSIESGLIPFRYVSKSSRRERNLGCEGLPEQGVHRYGSGIGRNDTPTSDPSRPAVDRNTHPTVKPLKLIKYLCTMICPPGGTILDMFAGSGTTGVAAVELGFNFIGIELEESYMAISQARINAAAATLRQLEVFG